MAREASELWPTMLETHHRILREVWERFGGKELGTEGDSHFVSFERAANAVQAAVEAQRNIGNHHWPGDGSVRIRAGIHTGEAMVKGRLLSGLPLHEAARIGSAAHGGQILMSGSTYEIIARSKPQGIVIKDLGEHRFKDLEEPRRIFQVWAEGLETVFAPLRAAAGRHNLPSPVTSFVGRAEEMLQVKGLISSHQLVTLIGTGGAGKTRLALELGHRLLEGFQDGIWFIDLSSIDEAELVAQVTLSTLRLKEDPGRPPIDALTNALVTMNTLLIFDNCERVIEGCVELAKHVLKSCPRVSLLMTSRQSLGVAGEATWHVLPLGIPPADGESLDQNLGAHESVQLFLSRASLVRPGFSITNSNARSIARICRRVEGLPLAIELAASKADVLPIDAIAKRLEDSFRLLGDTRGTSLRAVIDSSYGLLSEAEKSLFARLSVFGGGWTLETAEEVCADEGIASGDVLGLLSALVRKSLVALGIEDSGRYRMLETIREYGQDKLAGSEERDRTYQAFVQWLIALASQREAKFRSDEFTVWLDIMDEERDNIRTALSMCLAEESFSALGIRLAIESYAWWKVRGPRAEGQKWLEEFASIGGPGAEGQWEALTHAADLASDRGELDHARRNFSNALDLAAEEPSELPRAHVLRDLSFFEFSWGDDDEAMRIGKDALSVYEKLDQEAANQMRYRLARIATAAGDVSARALLEQGLSEASEAHYRGLCSRTLGLSHLLTDELDEAERLFTAAYEDARSVKCVDCGASSMNLLASTAGRKGDRVEASRLYTEALRQHSSIEHVGGVLDSLRGLGACFADSDPERAAILLGASEGMRARLSAGRTELGRHSDLEWAEGEIERRLDAGTRNAATKRGAAMSLSEMIAFALKEGETMSTISAPGLG